MKTRENARAALFGQQIAPGASQGERALVNNAGAEAVDPTIRDQIDFESQSIVRRNEDFVNRVLSFGGGQGSSPVNAEDEAERLRRDEQIRRATGGGQVVIERERGGFKLPGT
jgi:hypothetical protein